MKKKIDLLVDMMTLRQKAQLCVGASEWKTASYPKLGIPELVMADGPHGLRRIETLENGEMHSIPATCFPTASLTAATWNPALITEMGEALGEECIAQGVDILLGPGVNIKRSPLGGRNFEYFSEDPFLAGEMAAAYIHGVQSKGVGTSLKHFAVNNQETRRFFINALVSERALREIYLPAFEKAVTREQPYTVMCAYNQINGFYASENFFLLCEALREDWGFKGLVISDWGAVHDRVQSLWAGLDLQMPGPSEGSVRRLIKAVKEDEVPELLIDCAVKALIALIFKCKQVKKEGNFSAQKHHELAQKIASEGIVLLKNEGVLPLAPGKTLAVIGRSAEQAHIQGAGSSHINPTMVDQPLEMLKNADPAARIKYAAGYAVDDRQDPALIQEAVELAKNSDCALLFIALPASVEAEGYDRKSLDLTSQQVKLIKAVSEVQPKTVVILNTGAPVVVSEWIDQVPALVEAYMMGQGGAKALVDILSGKVNPSGKLAESFPIKLKDTPACLNWPGDHNNVLYGEDIFVGYRYYDTREIPVQFPFGHGLSYTEFRYENARLSASEIKDQDGADVFVDVKNAGQLKGKETVQVYVHQHNPRLPRPEKELKGFAKVDLEPGESKTVRIHLDQRAFQYWDQAYGSWVTDEDQFEVLVGASSRDIRASLPLKVRPAEILPSILDMNSTLEDWMNDPYGKEIMGQTVADLLQKMQEAGVVLDNTMGMDYMDMFRDVPLPDILKNLPSELLGKPETFLKGLLKQVHLMEKSAK